MALDAQGQDSGHDRIARIPAIQHVPRDLTLASQRAADIRSKIVANAEGNHHKKGAVGVGSTPGSRNSAEVGAEVVDEVGTVDARLEALLDLVSQRLLVRDRDCIATRLLLGVVVNAGCTIVRTSGV